MGKTGLLRLGHFRIMLQPQGRRSTRAETLLGLYLFGACKEGLAVVVVLSSDTGQTEESYENRLGSNDAVGYILDCKSCMFDGTCQ
ncbi:hypothetical protein KVT40_004724 [Elsinoe batatas]|uniref:Uncharacterized protein n=1 Tax=Elsinoe batatas TaxID=2601811 RepID=A0A8K0PEX5_9PEZI|nr:hypothetical protein KVT40_004724 [Elsinoe batatas]